MNELEIKITAIITITIIITFALMLINNVWSMNEYERRRKLVAAGLMKTANDKEPSLWTQVKFFNS